jgi:hypothetical protein
MIYCDSGSKDDNTCDCHEYQDCKSTQVPNSNGVHFMKEKVISLHGNEATAVIVKTDSASQAKTCLKIGGVYTFGGNGASGRVTLSQTGCSGKAIGAWTYSIDGDKATIYANVKHLCV